MFLKSYTMKFENSSTYTHLIIITRNIEDNFLTINEIKKLEVSEEHYVRMKII